MNYQDKIEQIAITLTGGDTDAEKLQAIEATLSAPGPGIAARISDAEDVRLGIFSDMMPIFEQFAEARGHGDQGTYQMTAVSDADREGVPTISMNAVSQNSGSNVTIEIPASVIDDDTVAQSVEAELIARENQVIADLQARIDAILAAREERQEYRE